MSMFVNKETTYVLTYLLTYLLTYFRVPLLDQNPGYATVHIGKTYDLDFGSPVRFRTSGSKSSVYFSPVQWSAQNPMTDSCF